jgi:hypothetical protein
MQRFPWSFLQNIRRNIQKHYCSTSSTAPWLFSVYRTRFSCCCYCYCYFYCCCILKFSIVFFFLSADRWPLPSRTPTPTGKPIHPLVHLSTHSYTCTTRHTDTQTYTHLFIIGLSVHTRWYSNQVNAPTYNHQVDFVGCYHAVTPFPYL